MTMHNPPHPGVNLRYEWVEPLGLTTEALAGHLGVTRATVSRVLNGKSAITADFAVRLEDAGMGKASSWLRLQASYDIANATHHEVIRVAS